MWMGGLAPLGYDLPTNGTRALDENAGEAETVRQIFQRYLALGSVHQLVVELQVQGIHSKVRTTAKGKTLVWLSRPENGIFGFADIREVLIAIDDRERGRALWTLSTCLKKYGDWNEFVKPFIENAWPRQLRFRSDETSRGFLHIAENAGAEFPDAVSTILPLVRPIPNADLFTFRLSKDREDRKSVARKHPREALILLNAITADDRAQMPYDLRGALEALAELEPSVRETVEFRRLRGLVD